MFKEKNHMTSFISPCILGKETHIYSNQQQPDFHQKITMDPNVSIQPCVCRRPQEKWAYDFHDDATPLSFQLQVTED